MLIGTVCKAVCSVIHNGNFVFFPSRMGCSIFLSLMVFKLKVMFIIAIIQKSVLN